MNSVPTGLFCFTIDNQHFAIPLVTVERILMAMAVTPVPDSPPVIHGLIDYHGIVVPVINLRYKLKLPLQPIRLKDVFIIANTDRRKIALVADEANNVITPAVKDLVSAVKLDSDFEADGILRLDDGIIFIYDIEKFLSPDEENELQQAMDIQANEPNNV